MSTNRFGSYRPKLYDHMAKELSPKSSKYSPRYPRPFLPSSTQNAHDHQQLRTSQTLQKPSRHHQSLLRLHQPDSTTKIESPSYSTSPNQNTSTTGKNQPTLESSTTTAAWTVQTSSETTFTFLSQDNECKIPVT